MPFIVLKRINLQTSFETNKYINNEPVTDQKLINRIKRYIIRNRSDKILDADTMVIAMRSKYPEYSKRKFILMKGLIGKILIQLQNYDFEETDYESSSDDESKYTVKTEEPFLSYEQIKEESNGVPYSVMDAPTMANSDDFFDTTTETVSGCNNRHIEPSPMSAILNRLYNINAASSSSCTRFKESSKPKTREFGIQADTTPSPSRKRIVHKEQDAGYMKRKRQVDDEETSYSKGEFKVPNIPVRRNEENHFNISSSVPTISFANVAGCKLVLKGLMQFLVHIHHPEVFTNLGIDTPRGFLLHGPPGCGKTLIAHAVAGELKVPLLNIAATELVTGISGESEERVRKVFDEALKIAPCILFIDEIDAISGNRSNSNREMERRIVSQLLLSIDRLNNDRNGAQVLLIGATSRPDAIDPALRRAGRFDKEVLLGIPDQESRFEILNFLCSQLQLSDNVSLKQIASLTPGFVGADLLALIRESVLCAVHRIIVELGTLKDSSETDSTCEIKIEKPVGCINSKPSFHECIHGNRIYLFQAIEESISKDPFIDLDQNSMQDVLSWIRDKTPIDPCYLEKLRINRSDFLLALKKVQPSAKREGFATVPNITWDDIGSLKDIRKELNMSLVEPMKYHKYFDDLGVATATGVLLCGPPGCGKTLIAKAMANETGINFISVKGPELLNMYFGGSEKAIRECFQRARSSQPCIIFFDELDALCPKRTDSDLNGSTSRIVNQLLTEMDGVEERGSVLLMAATNRPDILDPAVLRPGRFDKVLYVGFPEASDRVDILYTITRKGKQYFNSDVNLETIANNELCEGYTGADLAALVRETMSLALHEHIIACEKDPSNLSTPIIRARHFLMSLHKIRPSITPEERIHYDNMRRMYSSSRRKPQASIQALREERKKLNKKRIVSQQQKSLYSDRVAAVTNLNQSQTSQTAESVSSNNNFEITCNNANNELSVKPKVLQQQKTNFFHQFLDHETLSGTNTSICNSISSGQSVTSAVSSSQKNSLNQPALPNTLEKNFFKQAGSVATKITTLTDVRDNPDTEVDNENDNSRTTLTIVSEEKNVNNSPEIRLKLNPKPSSLPLEICSKDFPNRILPANNDDVVTEEKPSLQSIEGESSQKFFHLLINSFNGPNCDSNPINSKNINRSVSTNKVDINSASASSTESSPFPNKTALHLLEMASK